MSTNKTTKSGDLTKAASEVKRAEDKCALANAKFKLQMALDAANKQVEALQAKLTTSLDHWDDLLEDLEMNGDHDWAPYQISKNKYNAFILAKTETEYDDDHEVKPSVDSSWVNAPFNILELVRYTGAVIHKRPHLPDEFTLSEKHLNELSVMMTNIVSANVTSAHASKLKLVAYEIQLSNDNPHLSYSRIDGLKCNGLYSLNGGQ